jgi:hypothetical protein
VSRDRKVSPERIEENNIKSFSAITEKYSTIPNMVMQPRRILEIKKPPREGRKFWLKLDDAHFKVWIASEKCAWYRVRATAYHQKTFCVWHKVSVPFCKLRIVEHEIVRFEEYCGLIIHIALKESRRVSKPWDWDFEYVYVAIPTVRLIEGRVLERRKDCV